MHLELELEILNFLKCFGKCCKCSAALSKLHDDVDNFRLK